MTAPVYRVTTGRLPAPPTGPATSLGFLVLKGVLLYEVTVCERTTAELVGPGDLIDPSEPEPVSALPSSVAWSVLEQALLADLNPDLWAGAGERGHVADALLARATRRAQLSAVQRSITSHVRVDVRILAYLWHLADRFGVVQPGEVRLDLSLTHAVIARLIGARRPTVTTALQRLIQLGYLRRDGRAFVLLGDAGSVAELDGRSPARDFAVRS
ncbi:MAG: family transcriptional regulator, cyclic receptor protein [Thermoleophilaceae bacterium]|nr:family transcriptional regulator, cyclic receptor protein [Thermoleophilaceae bacterium]